MVVLDLNVQYKHWQIKTKEILKFKFDSKHENIKTSG
jgi:hypothetical protein